MVANVRNAPVTTLPATAHLLGFLQPLVAADDTDDEVEAKGFVQVPVGLVGGGATITVSAQGPSALSGSEGDLHLRINAMNQVISISRRGITVWATYTVAAGDGDDGTSIYAQFSADGSAWHNDEQAGDRYIRFGSGMTRPADDSTAWGMGFRFVGSDGAPGVGSQGVQGIYRIFIYRNVASGSIPTAAPVGGSYVIATNTITTPSSDWTDTPVSAPTGQVTVASEAQINPATQTGTVTPIWSPPYQAGLIGSRGLSQSEVDARINTLRPEVELTQAAYDALTSKDANTTYYIIG